MEARVPKSNHQPVILLFASSHKDKLELWRKEKSSALADYFNWYMWDGN